MDILNVIRAEGQIKPTHIMYRANLSWRVLMSFLNFLMSKGIIEMKENSEIFSMKQYLLTQKGLDLLFSYEAINKALSE